MLALVSWETRAVEVPGLDVAAAYREHGRFVAHVIQGLTGPGPHVEELLQETFIVAHKKRQRYDGRAAVRTWLYGIARNLSLRHNRGKRRFFGLVDRLRGQPAPAAPSSPEQEVLESERLGLFYEALEGLLVEQREVFVLYELEEQGGAAIAELLGIPLGTVWTRLRAARERFKKQLERRRAKEGT